MQRQIQMKEESILGDSYVKVLPPGGELLYIHDFIDNSRADELFSTLIDEPFWESRSITMFGKKVMQPRMVGFQGDFGVSYAYSGNCFHAEPWHEDLHVLKEKIEQKAEARFNCVLLNLYRDGRDSMGWHSDDEAELGLCPTIASVTLGARRRFILRSKADKRKKMKIEPASGSLIIMRGDVQRYWQHALPRTARCSSPRINLTFRQIVRPRRPQVSRKS